MHFYFQHVVFLLCVCVSGYQRHLEITALLLSACFLLHFIEKADLISLTHTHSHTLYVPDTNCQNGLHYTLYLRTSKQTLY